MQDFKKLAIIGEGSHSKVFLVETAEGEKLALKVYEPRPKKLAEYKILFLNETAALTRLSHLNIIKMLDFKLEETSFCLLMEYCPYGSLKHQLHEEGRFNLRKTLKVGISVLKGLQEMHARNIIHRDVKPDNIVQGNNGIIKLIDFSLAKIDQDLLGLTPRGSVAYIAPEQYTNFNGVDPRTDIYSLGATLFHLYTGRELFESNDLSDILESHLMQVTPALTTYVEDCPPSFNYCVRKMICKNPADRYQDTKEALADLQACYDGILNIHELPSILNFKQLAQTIELPKPQIPAKTTSNFHLWVITGLLITIITLAIIFILK